MKKTILALLPAIIAHLGLIVLAKANLDHLAWLIPIAILFLLGGALSGKFVTDAIKEKNVDRNPLLMISIGLIVAIIYVLTFMFTGCVFAVSQGA